MKLSSISIHGMHRVTDATYDLSDMTYFYGKNGAGKSTIMQAIQLGILGYIPGTDKTNAAIFKHSNGPMMSVCLLFDDGTEILRQWFRDGKSIKNTITTKPEGFDVESLLGNRTLPICNFNEFIGMTANKLKDWFVEFLPKSSKSIDWSAELKAVAPTVEIIDKSMLDDAVGLLEGEQVIARLKNFNAICKENMSVLKGDVQRIDHTIQSLVYYDDCDSTITNEDIQEKLRVLKIRHSAASEKVYKCRSNDKIKDKLSKLTISQYSPSLDDNQEYKELLDKLAECTKDLEFLEEEVPRSSANIATTINQIHNHEKIISGGGICPFTNSTCDIISQQIQQLKGELETLNETLNHQQIHLNSAKTKLRNTKDEYNKVKYHISAIKAEYTTYDSLKSQIDESLGDMELANAEAEVAEISKEIDKLQDLAVKVAANEKYEKLAAELHSEKQLAEEKLTIYKAWEKLSGVNGWQSKIMIAPFTQFESAMTPILTSIFHNNVSAKFLVGEKANSFEFGIVRDGSYVEYGGLSSGEKCLFTLALLITINQQSNSDSEFRLLLIDDLLDHLDPPSIAHMLKTLYKITGIQIVLAGVQHSDIPEFDKFTVRIGE